MADFESHSGPHPDVAGYVLGTLDAGEAELFVAHLADCDACRRELEELAVVGGLLADVPNSSEPLPPGLQARTFAAIEAAATAPGARTAGITPLRPAEQLPAPAGSDRASVGRVARRRRFLRPVVAAVAAAAAVITVVAAGVATIDSRRTHQPAPLATVRLIAAVTGEPGSGTAVIRAAPSGITIDMTVEGLPPAPPGKMYTCWLVAGDDTLAHPDRVSVGSFVVRGQKVEAHWTTAADRQRFPHLGITLEPDNGNPGHQGPKVLTAT